MFQTAIVSDEPLVLECKLALFHGSLLFHLFGVDHGHGHGPSEIMGL